MTAEGHCDRCGINCEDCRIDDERHVLATSIAAKFHAAYEALAPDHGWKPQAATSVPFDYLPEANRSLMIATVTQLLVRHVIEPGELALPSRSRI